MWYNLLVYHSETKNFAQTVPSGFLVWETCMRILYIGDRRLISNLDESSTEVYSGYKAYKLLLEIICGLHSKLFAETEVFFQFKENFQNKLLPKTLIGESFQKLRDNLIEDAKKVRANHLLGLKVNSYGAITEKLLNQADEIILIGTGQLATRVLRSIRGKDRKILVIGRNKEVLERLKRLYSIEIQELQDRIPSSSNIVICAPIPIEPRLNFDLKETTVIDLRENPFHEKFDNAKSYHSFQKILSQIEENESKHKFLRYKLDFVLSKIVHERESVCVNHINCWEDIPCSVL
ncbi:MAG: hypothetical protein SFU98_21200 [Leptospiraceae bacterium]|nr:hypothetical protein [Leptospiraceae bacterium]